VDRHELDVVSLLTGVVFVVLGMLWIANGQDDFIDQAVWLGPVVLMMIGVVLLASSAENRRKLRSVRSASASPGDEEGDSDGDDAMTGERPAQSGTGSVAP
jgi:hypothetical protein